MRKESQHSEVSSNREVPLPPMLFDLDGTLVDSAYHHVIAWHETFADFRMDIPNWKIHRRIGMSGSFFLPRLLREIGHSGNPAQIKRLEKRHAQYFTPKIKSIRVLPGARELLRHLTKINLPWTIATTGERAQMEKLVKDLDLPKSLPIVTGDDVKNAKPAPDIFLAAAQKLGVSITRLHHRRRQPLGYPRRPPHESSRCRPAVRRLRPGRTGARRRPSCLRRSRRTAGKFS